MSSQTISATTPSDSRDLIVGRRAEKVAGGVSIAALLKTVAAATLMSLLGMAATMLVWRRLAGALLEPLGLAELAVLASVLAAAGFSIRSLGKNSFGNRATENPWPARLIRLAPTAAICTVGFALSLPGTSAAGLAVFWSLIVAAETYCLVPHRPRRLSQTVAKDVATTPRTDSVITQRLVRTITRDGEETIAGTLQANLEAGQRTATVHVAFCPPFAALPDIEFEQTGGPAGNIKAVQLLPHGARFDIKLSKKFDEPTGVSLSFRARC